MCIFEMHVGKANAEKYKKKTQYETNELLYPRNAQKLILSLILCASIVLASTAR